MDIIELTGEKRYGTNMELIKKAEELDMINKYHHPFFWAPFVLIGDWN